METIREFICRNREALLKYLDGQAPSASGEPEPLQFVDNVVGEWISLFGGKKIQAPTARERTFWFTLYLFEELQEVPPALATDSFAKSQRKTLERMRMLLRNNVELPKEFYATRPGEMPEGLDEEDLEIGRDDEVDDQTP